MCDKKDFDNLLEPGKQPSMIKSYKAQCVQNFDHKLNPHTLKLHVLRSEKLSKIVKYYAQHNGQTVAEVQKQVVAIIDEIALDRNLTIIRCCGMTITAIGQRICDAIYVNKPSIERVKSNLGHHPVLYLPSHRSYMDFILMSYICFHYDIEIPGIAAGMDFHAMFGMGTMLRKTGAFFMRRSFSNDELYWDVFREYMYALVAEYHIGVEFFLEGTRSRNFKALKPKVGLLSMALLPYFTGQVNDITVIPVSISYDRIMEEQLFVYELLGVPKPKETTKGFIKALKIIEERFGSMYIDFGQPISINKFFNDCSPKLPSSLQNRATIATSLQKLQKREIELIKQLANEVVFQQQCGIVLSIFSLICLHYASQSYMQQHDDDDNDDNEKPTVIRMDTLDLVLLKMKSLFEQLGACVAITTTNENNNNNNLIKEILNTLQIHKNIIELHENKSNFKLRQLTIDTLNPLVNKERLKAHALQQRTMAIAVPILSLQLYINPTLFWLAKPAFMLVAALEGKLLPGLPDLKARTWQIEQIFKYEFVLEHATNKNDYENFFQFLQQQHIFELSTTNDLRVHHNNASNMILSAFAPFLCLYYQLAVTLSRMSAQHGYTMAEIMILQQQRIEQLMLNNNNCQCAQQFVHPYCLALDNLHIAMNYFLQENYLVLQQKMDGQLSKTTTYCVNLERPLEPLVLQLFNYCRVLPFRQYFEEFHQIDNNSSHLPAKL